MMKSFFALASVALLAVACGGSGSSTPPSETPSTSSSGTPSAVTSATPEPGGGGAGCKDKDGKVHAVGDQWNDGCNECSCGPNGAKCTRRACN